MPFFRGGVDVFHQAREIHIGKMPGAKPGASLVLVRREGVKSATLLPGVHVRPCAYQCANPPASACLK